MASMGARSVFQSFPGAAGHGAARIGSQPWPTPSSPFRMATNKPLSHRNFRCAAESMMPFRSASSAASMTSMLSISSTSWGWLRQQGIKRGVKKRGKTSKFQFTELFTEKEMEDSAAVAARNPDQGLCSPRRNTHFIRRKHSPLFFFKLHKRLRFPPCNARQSAPPIRKEALEVPDIDWDNLGFRMIPTDYMYVMKCSHGGNFSNGELQRFGNIELSPSAGVLNYGQGLFEGLRAYRKEDGSILLFRPEENALRMRLGAERMCMPSPTVDQFLEAVKATVAANKRWVPPSSKGSLYIRPLLIGSGAVLGLSPAPEFTFLIYVSPVGNYFKQGTALHLVIEHELHRATPGGTGGVKAIGNYATTLKAQSAAKAKGYSDVLYLDCVHKKYLEEVSSCNIFVVKGDVISTPAIKGTILPGITRKSIIDLARSHGFQVEERLVGVDELVEAEEVFCTGTAVVVSPVGSVTYLGKRISYGEGVGVVSQQLYSLLTRLQTGLMEDNMNWTVTL